MAAQKAFKPYSAIIKSSDITKASGAGHISVACRAQACNTSGDSGSLFFFILGS